MADTYSMMGEPSNVLIVDHHVEGKCPIYQYSSIPNFGGASYAMMGGITQMMAAPTLDDLFHSNSSEAVAEQDLSTSQLLYNYIDKGKVPSNNRCREAFGFNKIHNHKNARDLLGVYAVVKQNGVHGELLSMWRTMATMTKNIEKLITSDTEGGKKFPDRLKSILMLLDQDMQGCATRWYAFETKLRSRMIAPAPGCIKCGVKENLRGCSRCLGIQYCSKECQAADWLVHKSACSKEEKERLSAQYEKAKKDGSADKESFMVTSMGGSPRDMANVLMTS